MITLSEPDPEKVEVVAVTLLEKVAAPVNSTF
jgi:hypothetical protein